MTEQRAFDRLARVVALAEAMGAGAEARALLERVREGRFFVACLGQFKRGKSTVINALLGEPVLPSGVAPVTSVVTVVRFGERRARVRVGIEDWRDVPISDLHLHVGEAGNPENVKGVTAVEVFCQSPLLAQGLCLVDTPGIGSVFAGNTEETCSFVPHIDAALVVLGGDPPISGDELELVTAVAEDVTEIVFVLNKADRLSAGELREARVFTESVLAKHVDPPPSLFEISALERLEHRGSPREWPSLVEALDRLASAGAELAGKAAERETEHLVARLRGELVAEREALLRPVEESTRRLEELRRCAASAERSLFELTHIFNAEQNRLAADLDEDRAGFVASALPRAHGMLDESLDAAPVRRGPRLRRHALDEAQRIAEELVGAWMIEERRLAEAEFAAVTERFVAHASAFLARLRDSGQLPVDALPSLLVPDTALRARGSYCFMPFMTLTTPPLWLWLADCFRTERSALESARRASRALVRRLLEVNASRVVGDFAERMIESRRSVEGALRRTLQEIVVTAERASHRASDVKLRGASAVEAEVKTIEGRLADLESLT